MGILFNLEWKNINLQIEKSKFNLWKLKKNREEKVILNDGMHTNGYFFEKKKISIKNVFLIDPTRMILLLFGLHSEW